jgi:hypothetical protein
MRTWPNPQLRAKLERQAAALARAMLEGREGVLAGARRMHVLLFQLSMDDEPVRRAFTAILSETDHLPVGPERKHWAAHALELKDREIAQAEAHFRDLALGACREVLARFGGDLPR